MRCSLTTVRVCMTKGAVMILKLCPFLLRWVIAHCPVFSGLFLTRAIRTFFRDVVTLQL